jgi:hypothetical protein
MACCSMKAIGNCGFVNWLLCLVVKNKNNFVVPVELTLAMSCLLAYRSYVRNRHLRNDQVTPTLAILRTQKAKSVILQAYKKGKIVMLNAFWRGHRFFRRCQNLHHVTGNSEWHGLLRPWKTQPTSSLVFRLASCLCRRGEGKEKES